VTDDTGEPTKGVATASCSYLWRYRCSVCGHSWKVETDVYDMTAYEPDEDEEIDCENEECDATLIVKLTE
jgi:hypothetical protein